MLIQLNVGLLSATTGNLLNALSVQTAVCQAFPEIRPFGISARVAQSATEPTLICQFEYPDSTLAADIAEACQALCIACEQDAVAIKCDQTGLILGPNAAKWGAFDAAQFIPFFAPNAPIQGLTLERSHADVCGWGVNIAAGGFHGWFERDRDGFGGSLTFSLESPDTGAIDGYLHLIDYDGVSCLPRCILQYLRGLGISAGDCFE